MGLIYMLVFQRMEVQRSIGVPYRWRRQKGSALVFPMPLLFCLRAQPDGFTFELSEERGCRLKQEEFLSPRTMRDKGP